MARWGEATGQRTAALWLRFGAGRPLSAVPLDFLTWCVAPAQTRGQRAVLVGGDQAPWPDSHRVRTGVRQHHRPVKQCGQGGRLSRALVPSTSPWLNPLAPQWRHGQRTVRDPEPLLTTAERVARVCAV